MVQVGISKLKECGCDGILAFGGGSAIDAGKAIAVFSANLFDLGKALSYSLIQLVSGHLRRAVGDGSNLEARHKMAVASYMAGMSFSNAGFGLCHAMAHQLGAQYKLPHGLANALVLPEVMHFNMLVRQDRLGEIALAFNQRVGNLDPKEAAIQGIESVRELIADVGLPTQLRQVQANEADFETMASRALEDPTILTNPRTVGREDIIAIFRRYY